MDIEEKHVLVSYESYNKLFNAIKEHHDQKADDRCIEDDDKLYDAAGLQLCDRRVGSKAEMLENCKRYIENRCESGGWQTYKELERERDELKSRVKQLEDEFKRVIPFLASHGVSGYVITPRCGTMTTLEEPINRGKGFTPYYAGCDLKRDHEGLHYDSRANYYWKGNTE